MGGKICWCHGSNNSRGVAILVKPGFDYEIILEYEDDSGRFLMVNR
jgi:hypothetical protein